MNVGPRLHVTYVAGGNKEHTGRLGDQHFAEKIVSAISLMRMACFTKRWEPLCCARNHIELIAAESETPF
jgi:hypothetical protein